MWSLSMASRTLLCSRVIPDWAEMAEKYRYKTKGISQDISPLLAYVLIFSIQTTRKGIMKGVLLTSFCFDEGHDFRIRATIEFR